MLNFEIEQHVPKFILNDRNGYAIAKALEAAIRYMNKKIEDGVDCITNVDKMPEWRLDELAREYNIYYDYSQDIEIKRRWIREAVKTYALYGTPGILRNMIAATFGSGDVSEWFDYNGDPYFFKVITESMLDENNYLAFQDVIRHVKNVRSVLEALEVQRETDQTLYFAPEMYEVQEPPAIVDGYTVENGIDQDVFVAAELVQFIEPQIIIDGGNYPDRSVQTNLFAGTLADTLFEQTIQ